MIKRIVALSILLLLIPSLAFAWETGYRGYNYNVYMESIAAPNAFLPLSTYIAPEFGATAFKNPQDIFAAPDGHIFIADSGNNRIVELDAELRFVREFNSVLLDGAESGLSNPCGVFVRENGDIYIADSGNARTLWLDKELSVMRVFANFKSALISSNFNYQPEKVIVDNSDIVYILSKGCFQGMLTFDQSGTFLGFFGANTINPTPAMVVQRLWKKLMSDEQRSASVRTIPTAYSSVYLDDKGFIYATIGRDFENTTINEIRKLNPKGSNVFAEGDYGDWEIQWVGGVLYDSKFADVATHDEIVYALDVERNRVFVYDQEGYLIGVFGGSGSNAGNTQLPVAVEALKDGRVLLLDARTGSVTVYAPTEYGRLAIEGTLLYNDGRYAEAEQLWRRVLAMNANNELAYVSLGRTALKLGDSEAAMDYFRLGEARALYSDAFREWRKDFIRDNFGWIFACIVCLLIGVSIRALLKKRHVRPDYEIVKRSGVRFAIYAMFHPVHGFEEVKDENNGSAKLGCLILFLFFVSSIISDQYTAFTFNIVRAETYNVFITALSTLAPACFFVVVNWAMCTLMNGEGKMREIWVATTYSLLPLFFMNLVNVGLSYIIVAEEAVFVVMLSAIMTLWAGVMLYQGVRIVHQYTGFRTILALIITVIGLAIVVFIIVLVYSLVQEIYVFGNTIYKELLFRYS